MSAAQLQVQAPAALGSHFARYAAMRTALGIKPGTLETELEQHRNFWRYLAAIGFERDELAVSRKDMQEYARVTFSNDKLSISSKRIRLQRLRPFYYAAYSRGWMFYDPTSGIRLPKEEKNPIRTITVKQMKELLALPDLTTALGIRDRTMMELMYSSGLRRNEVVNLKRDDLGEDYRTVRVLGKGDKEAVLPVGRMAAHFLRFYAESVWPLLNPHQEPYLFLAARSGRRINKHPFYCIVRGYAQKLGLHEIIGPHVFRYSICTHLAEEGVDIRVLQEFMRHDKISTTARYIKQSFEKLREVHARTHPRSAH